MRWKELDEERCSVARAVSVIGDRWTLLVLRDCFLKVRRFEDFEARLGITRHVLADRLAKLVEAGVLKRVPYQERPVRHEYRLTAKGRALQPVMLALVHWGDTHMPVPEGRPVIHRHLACGHDFEPVTTCSCCGEAVAPHDVEARPGPGAADGLV
jgi:DNA-binding HxlR family transcriptional regulator